MTGAEYLSTHCGKFPLNKGRQTHHEVLSVAMETPIQDDVQRKIFSKTRLHSSRMRTARSSGRPGGGVFTRHTLPPKDETPPQEQTPPTQSRPPRSRHPPPPGADNTSPGADTPLLTESQTPVKI